jgi:hypothetical protein
MNPTPSKSPIHITFEQKNRNYNINSDPGMNHFISLEYRIFMEIQFSEIVTFLNLLEQVQWTQQTVI